MTEEWMLDELVERAAQALAAADVRAPNGRVTEVPDGRMVRWYATIGLVDRPSAMRGRTALYGPRHLLQLVAVKRRQAQGKTLADIQVELTGATDAVLRRVADVPPHPEAPAKRFWRQVGQSSARPEGILSGVPLGKGVLLLLPSVPGEDDLAAIAATAKPLLELLAARGLLTPPVQRSEGSPA